MTPPDDFDRWSLWDPNAETRPAFEAALQSYLDWASGLMDEAEIFLEVLP